MQITEIKGLKARAAARIVVPITNVSGVKLRRSPSTNAKVIEKLGVGDKVEVIRRAEGDPVKGDSGLWAFVKPVRSAKGAFDLDSGQPGWVLDRDLGYTERFKRITSWKKQSISAEIGDYAFTIDIRTDGSFTHRSSPCVDCGEKPECSKGETRVGGECVSRGHLYRYDNFVWARKPTKYQEYFFIDGNGKLRSVSE